MCTRVKIYDKNCSKKLTSELQNKNKLHVVEQIAEYDEKKYKRMKQNIRYNKCNK